MKTFALLLLFTFSLSAEIHTLTLKQAIDLALRQNPDLAIARLDEQKSLLAVRVARDPFVPKIYGGSGLAYTSGFPTSIEGSAPSIFQARTNMAIYNRYQSFQVAQASENAHSAQIDVQARGDDIAYRTALLFLDVEQAQRSAGMFDKQIESMQKLLDSVLARVNEGSELPLQSKRAELNLQKVRQRYEILKSNREYAETSLAMVLGFPSTDRVRAVLEERPPFELPATPEESAEAALKNSKEVRRLESSMLAKGLEVRAQRALRIPQVDLVAQYSLFAKHNYEDFFPRFSRHNGQLGVSITVPLLVGSAAGGLAAQAEREILKLRIQMTMTRNRISFETNKSFQEVKNAETAGQIAKLDLEVSREDISVLLAQYSEGRVPMSRVEQARLDENEKWIAFYETQQMIERARLSLLRQTGRLVAALR